MAYYYNNIIIYSRFIYNLAIIIKVIIAIIILTLGSNNIIR
jgi:hypothetical protein